MDDGLIDAGERLDYTLVEKEEVALEQRTESKSRKKGSLDSRIPTDICLCGSGTATFVTGLLGKKYRTIHKYCAYTTAGFAALHLYQHWGVVTGYAKKKYRDAKKRIDTLAGGDFAMRRSPS